MAAPNLFYGHVDNQCPTKEVRKQKDKPSGDATKDLDKENQIPNVQASNSMPASPTRPNRETAKAEKESVTPTVIFFS